VQAAQLRRRIHSLKAQFHCHLRLCSTITNFYQNFTPVSVTLPHHLRGQTSYGSYIDSKEHFRCRISHSKSLVVEKSRVGVVWGGLVWQ
jgi:hypothetical protein